MDIVRAKEILTALADGVNPLTGEILPPEDSCNQADVVRALHAVIDAIPTAKSKPQLPNAGKPWTDSEIQKLSDEFDSGIGIAEIAKSHGRTKGSIESRLSALGKIEDTYFTRKLMKR